MVKKNVIAVLAIAMFMVTAGAVFMAESHDVDADVTTLQTKIWVKENELDVGEEMDLSYAIINQADIGTIWEFYEGTYDLDPSEWSTYLELGQTGWYLPLNVEGMIVKGAGKGMTLLTSSYDSENGALSTQNFITVMKDNVTISNLSIKTKVESNKVIEAIGMNFTLSNVEILVPEDGSFAGSVSFRGPDMGNVILEDLYIEGGRISFWAVDDGTIAIENVTIDISVGNLPLVEDDNGEDVYGYPLENLLFLRDYSGDYDPNTLPSDGLKKSGITVTSSSGLTLKVDTSIIDTTMATALTEALANLPGGSTLELAEVGDYGEITVGSNVTIKSNESVEINMTIANNATVALDTTSLSGKITDGTNTVELANASLAGIEISTDDGTLNITGDVEPGTQITVPAGSTVTLGGSELPEGTYTVDDSGSLGSIAVTFDSKGGSDIGTRYYAEGDTYGTIFDGVLPIPAMDGFDFAGWFSEGTLVKPDDYVYGDITVYAMWTPAKTTYTVTFAPNGGEFLDPSKSTMAVDIDNAVFDALPILDARDGFEFTGWFYFDVKVEAGDAVPGDITVYAAWENVIDYYTVIFMPGGGEFTSGSAVIQVSMEDPTIDEFPVVVFDGFEFIGWYAEGKEIVMKDGSYTVEKDMEIHALWTFPTTYGIRFDANGGLFADIDDAYKVLKPDEEIGDFPVVTREGYKLVGWIYNTGDDVDEEDVLTRSVIVYAVWEKVIDYFTVTFEAEGALLTNFEGRKVIQVPMSNPYIEMPEATFGEFELIGWFADGIEVVPNGEGEYDGMYEVTKDIAMYALWKIPTKYTVTFEANGGLFDNIGDSGRIITANGEIGELPVDVTKAGFKFVKWIYADGEDVDAEDPVTMNMIIYAVWEEDITDYKIIFIPDGGKFLDGSSAVMYVPIGDDAKITALPEVEFDGFEFMGWYSDGVELKDGQPVASNMVAYAAWRFIQTEYTITFAPNGGVMGDSDTTRNVDIGAKFGTLPDVTKEGFTLAGWFYFDIEIDEDDVVPGDITVYAKWDKVIDYYTIVFIPDGGKFVSGSAIMQIPMASATIAELPVITSEGYLFDGWYSGDVKLEVGQEIDSDMVAYAFWSYQKTEYRVSFEPNGGELAEDAESAIGVTIGDSIGDSIDELPDASREGYDFIGWFYFDMEVDADYVPVRDMTVHAVWKSVGSIDDPVDDDATDKTSRNLATAAIAVSVVSIIAVLGLAWMIRR